MDKMLIICWLLLAVLQIFIPSSAAAALNTTGSPVSSTSVFPPKPANPSDTHPNNISVAVGEPVAFKCGAPEASQKVTFNLFSSHGNYSLTCPDGHVEDIPQALYGSCEVNNDEIFAVWTLKATSSDNNTKFICQQSNDPLPKAIVLHVYDNGARNAVLIGCVVGGFFGILLVFGLLFLLLKKSERFQNCLGVDYTEDDLDTIEK